MPGALSCARLLSLVLMGALAVDGVAQSIHDAAKHLGSDRDIDLEHCQLREVAWHKAGLSYNLARPLNGLALLDQSVGAEQHNTDLAGLEVHAHALDAGGEPGDVSWVTDAWS